MSYGMSGGTVRLTKGHMEVCTHVTSVLGLVQHVNDHSIASDRNIQCHVAAFPHYFANGFSMGTF